MKKLLLSVALAALAWTGLAAGASAATITTIGTINPNPVEFVSDTISSSSAGDTVVYAYKFSFSGTANGIFGALSLGLGDIATSINACGATCNDVGSALFSESSGGSLGLLSLSLGGFSGLTSGTYFLVISGLVSSFGGSFIGGLALNVTPTVPVPAALLLFMTAMAGLGAVKGFRRHGAKA